MARSCGPSPCPPKTPLARRRRLDAELVERLSELFGILSAGSRIRILHAVARRGEMHVQQVAAELGMKVAAVSNQLRLMAVMGILGSRSEGLKVFYRLVDPCVPQLLETGACLVVDSEARTR